MTLLYYDPQFLAHDTGSHPEQPERLRHIMARLEQTGSAANCARPDWKPAARARVARVHLPEYVDHIARMAASGGGQPDSDTVVSLQSYDVALLAAGAACDAVDRVIAGESKTALCVVRPPGHHALADRAMGFCLFNNIAIAACVARDEYQLDRVLIVDWDVHHGNGTQDAFYSDGRVGFLSSHRWPFYPGTGDVDETGTGDGLGATCNLPIAFGTPRDIYLDRFTAALDDFAARIRPQIVLVSAGFDSHRTDPVGSLGLETEDFAKLTAIVKAVAGVHAIGRIVSILEGGYNPPVLAECVETHLRGLMDS
ncbi:MAG TPA: histone deacetylase [Lacipirellulaceae bacterium]|nr:histone deacetylase [Lacipirellulaceae bacterium]